LLKISLSGIQQDAIIHHFHIEITWYREQNLKHLFQDKMVLMGLHRSCGEIIFQQLENFHSIFIPLECFLAYNYFKGATIFDINSIKNCKSKKTLDTVDWWWSLLINDGLNFLWIPSQAIINDDVTQEFYFWLMKEKI
jgi:hypothetical protein